MSSGAGTSALRFWASRFLRRQESHVGAMSALGARGYKTTTGIVGVEVDPEAPETLRHLLKKILRVSLEEGRTARRGRGWGGAREGGRPFQPFPSARDASSRAWPRGSRRESGKKKPRIKTNKGTNVVLTETSPCAPSAASHADPQEVKVIPENAQYRVSVEMMANQRLEVVSKDISPEQVRPTDPLFFLSPRRPDPALSLSSLHFVFAAGRWRRRSARASWRSSSCTPGTSSPSFLRWQVGGRVGSWPRSGSPSPSPYLYDGKADPCLLFACLSVIGPQSGSPGTCPRATRSRWWSTTSPFPFPRRRESKN